MRRHAVSLVIAVLTTVFVIGASQSVSAGKRPPELAWVTPAAVDAGATFTLDVSGFTCDDNVALDVSIRLNGGGPFGPFGTIPLASIASGAFSGPFDAPTTAGEYILEVRYASPSQCQRSAAAVLTVNLATTTTSTSTTSTTTTIAAVVAPTAASTTTAAVAAPALPATGQTTDGLVWAAVVVSLLGGGLVLVAARRD